MTNELEKQFFDTFGIEPKFKGYSNTEELSTGGVIPCGNIKYFNTIEEMDKANHWCFNMWELEEEDKEYPQITDRILLELICIWNQSCVYFEDFIAPINCKKVTETVLEYFVDLENYEFTINEQEIKHQVRTLFEEG